MPLNYLFIDMNSYFASVEQQDRPELRDRPVGVVPLLAETTCCIAASYEAKRQGVTTGTLVREARRLCPDICIVEARPHRYVTVHRGLVEAVESCLPLDAVLSIDEMACRLRGEDQRPDRAVQLAGQVKAAIRRRLGSQLRCSIGLAPNRMLAKVAADLQKPDGLTLIHSEDLPGRLYGLQLTDFPGIGRRMEQRLHRFGITTVQQLCQLSEPQLAHIWGSKVLGQQWWHRLRGDDWPEAPSRRRSVGHSHVLPPAWRHDAAARAVLMRLLHKAAMRLRQIDYWAGSLTLSIAFLDAAPWSACQRLDLCRDTLTLLRVLGSLWERKPPGTPLKVGVVLGNLVSARSVPQPLFEADRRLLALSETMDQLNHQFGAHAVYFAGSHGTEGQAPLRIAFTHIPDL
jgi:DNA polymerase-4